MIFLLYVHIKDKTNASLINRIEIISLYKTVEYDLLFIYNLKKPEVPNHKTHTHKNKGQMEYFIDQHVDQVLMLKTNPVH